MKKVFDIQSIDEVAKELLANVKHKTILFYGDMGAGKTTLISALVKALGGLDDVSSPTFSIVNEYEVTNDKVYHFDFYRIDNVTEVLDIGIEDYFYSGHWIFIEWPEKIEEILPLEADISYIKMNKDGSRTLELGVFGENLKIN
ncbi:tRNA (adenosine(37)-N6)-threonylcarbamoyltransferase complex ATPase subunit type 1 TsaE [Flavobacteriaceae bacterium S0825]|uniref:tRNA (adenosine(37)-N6)-threonylcarbamoyltransferase complex ATPase subunit type 1 TsaE n=1 Tax=Gaetbulibacter sp. S0825 TaxID=2720084 RepID=UPI001430BAA4|nr:tRNA (adenosine(37)-N6)-threonylcarbamoyltransferase complex ATPase subunit type 1 TsaE [Gaetbulibacter sp. S0825]MCK0109713.1 tRNA (adenosine(37)-N6)-threonylcarbamoyltransferase complex ATPase subunit type 1 TsaE [Flavobacteriaceae bacterium S0825]NIX65345.1 tRNA (adenosine(37)-N6)-threonylcarbamoyltransferase complex ATPase subunit type 1 TsaE [Gaetbulibacter sp. S0825]